MKKIQLVIPDLILPATHAEDASRGLKLPTLEKLLSRGNKEILPPVSLEHLLCDSFGLPCQPDIPIAPISAVYDGLIAGDGLESGCWLRADPVHLQLQRTHLLAAEVNSTIEEASAICNSLKDHFEIQGLEFFAPHPRRWYVKVKEQPRIRCTPISQAFGNDVRTLLPTGEEALEWNQIFNEIQMLLFSHPVNEARDKRGELPINSVWFWGSGCTTDSIPKAKPGSVHSDEELAKMLAKVSDIPYTTFQTEWNVDQEEERQLLVWAGLRIALQQGGMPAWRDSLQELEMKCAQPVWRAVRSGKIDQLRMDIPGAESLWRLNLSQRDTWAIWRRIRPLASYSMV